jgi:hypothetical protein
VNPHDTIGEAFARMAEQEYEAGDDHRAVARYVLDCCGPCDSVAAIALANAAEHDGRGDIYARYACELLLWAPCARTEERITLEAVRRHQRGEYLATFSTERGAFEPGHPLSTITDGIMP